MGARSGLANILFLDSKKGGEVAPLKPEVLQDLYYNIVYTSFVDQTVPEVTSIY